MTMFRVGPAGIPASLKSDMDAVLNKKFSTSTTYPSADWPDTVNLMGPLPERTASGSIAHIEDGASEVPLKNWLVTLPTSLSGYSSIVGTKSGKNLIDNKTYQQTANNLRVGTETSGGRLTVIKGTYTLSVKTAKNVSMHKVISGTTTNLQATRDGDYMVATFTQDETTTDLIFYVYINTGVTSADISEIQLECGSSRTTYTAYTAPTQYTASLGRTIYGGSADIVTGEGEDENGNAFTFTPITPTPETENVCNFWADGDSEVTYRADIDLLLNNL